ncbi:MAG: aminotransferase class III-fold pyridoxal phosphate-dependent enzyme, partial [Acidobacteriota bacterium]|nr:aminotransferase class III-fold pyridoxal phosphate-dependent enzyme [Acidobacteriota bacterium]
LWAGLTYSGHPVCCATAVANLKVYEEEDLFHNVEVQGEYLRQRLERLKAASSFVGDVRCIGLFSVIEFVKDKATKEPLAPYNGTSPEMAQIVAHLKKNHVYAFSRFNLLFVCPPLIITREELGQGLDVIESALQILEQTAEPQLAATVA